MSIMVFISELDEEGANKLNGAAVIAVAKAKGLGAYYFKDENGVLGYRIYVHKNDEFDVATFVQETRDYVDNAMKQGQTEKKG